MKSMRTVLFALAFLFFAGGIFVMTQPADLAQQDAEVVWVLQPDADYTVNLGPIGGGGGLNCYFVCTDGCPGICRSCCLVDGQWECETFSNGCNPL